MKYLLSGLLLLGSATAGAFACDGPRELLFLRDQIVMGKDGMQTYTDIYSIRADGSNESRLSKGALAKRRYDSNDAAWSPDGRQIVFVSNRLGDENPEVFRVRSDGAKVVRLSNDKGYDEYPDWSAKGGIAFSSNRGGKDFQLYSMDAQGGKLRQLVKSEDKDFDARWSPDGSDLAFTREHNGVLRIFVARDGEAPRPLTPAWFDAGEPAWAPDGESLVFSGNGHAAGTAHLELFSMLAKDTDGDGLGDQLQRLTETPADTLNMEPEVSGDGECLLFVRASGKEPEKSEILVMPVDGGTAVKIAEGFGARWRP